jgi:hypothetical protein
MDNQAILSAIEQLKQGIDALSSAVGGDASAAGGNDKGSLETPDAPVNPDEVGDAASSGDSNNQRQGMNAISVEDFINKKAGKQ